MFCGKRVGGYTLVELLVVIAIIGILVSLSVPAVYQVKQQMNQAQCAENLRQLAIATINYETSEGQLPGYLQKYGEFHGGVDPADPGNFGGAVPRHLKIASWPVAVLSKLDHQPLYERWALDRYPVMADNRGELAATTDGYSRIAAANVAAYQCPSASGSIDRQGLNNYIANAGMHVNAFPLTYTRADGTTGTVHFVDSINRSNGVMTNRYAGFDPADPNTLVPVGKPFRSSDFRDGRSSTMLLSENQQAQPWYRTRLTGNADHLSDIRTVAGKEVTVYPPESRYLQGAVWHFEDPHQTAGAAAVIPLHQINGGDVYNTFANSNNYPDVARPSSLHVGGVNMAMADGSVQYISETIDHRLYQALMTPHSRASDMPSNEYIAPLEL